VGDAVGDVLEGRELEALAREHVRNPGRIGGQRLGRDSSLGGVEVDDLLRGEEGLARGELGRAPGRRLREWPGRRLGSLSEGLDRVAEGRDQARARALRVLADPEHGDDDILGEELEVDVVVLSHQPRDPVAGGAGSPDVDDEAKRIVGVHPGPAGKALVEDVEPGDRADLLTQPAQRGHRLTQQRLAIARRLTAGGVERRGEEGIGASRLDERHGAVDHRRVDQLRAAEVEDRRLGDAPDDLVGR
jgi:hypothetical protein